MSKRLGSTGGFTLVELLIVLSIISVLALMATVSLGSSADRAYATAMQSDLRNVGVAQAAYAAETFNQMGRASYASQIGDLPLNLSPGVSIRLRANRNGWSARATHSRLPGRRCAVFKGSIRAFSPATQDGVISCD